MRTLGLAGVLTVAFGLMGSAFAQSPLAGPLASPDAAPAAADTPKKPAKAKPAHHKSKTAHTDKAAHTDKTAHNEAGQPAGSYEPAPEAAKPAVHAKKGDAAADPVSFGMKWNGSNDDARETRVQNYNGGAAGTGGEVGLNFHF